MHKDIELTDLERANLAREFTNIGGGIQDSIVYIRMRDKQGVIHIHSRPYWRDQATRIEAQIQEGLALLRAVRTLDTAERTFTAGFHAGPDEWHVGGSEDNVRVSSSLSAALIALAGEGEE